MAHYQVKITVQAVRLPDPVSQSSHEEIDPFKNAAGMMEKMASIVATQGPFARFRESGLTLGKEVEINVESFQELARALGLFDELADRIQCSNPVENS